MTHLEIPVSVQSRNNRDLPPTTGSISQVNYDKVDRSKNALKTLGIGLTLAFVCIFIPILHFFLVPTLFIGAFVMALEKTREDKRNEGGAGECPKCHSTFSIQKSKWSERLVDVCGSCHDDLEMHVNSNAMVGSPGAVES